MDGPLHVRVRGKVTGPFTKDELRSMARRGQLSRIHELSDDGEIWTAASKFPELFSAEAGISRRILTATPLREVVPVSAPPSRPAATSPEAQTPQEYWYIHQGQQTGPVDLQSLRFLASGGEISLSDLVWKSGMPQWARAQEVLGPEAFPSPVAESPVERSQQNSHSSDSGSSQLPESLCKAATSSYGWAQFIAVMTMIVATLELLGGLILMALGLDRHLASAMVSGLSSIVQAAVIATGGFLLLAYTSRLNSLRRFPSRVVLEKALDALRAYWIYISILLIITIAVILILAFWVFSVSGLLMDSSRSHF